LGDKWDTLSEDDQDLLIYNYYNTGGPDKNKGDPNASMGDKALWRLEKVKQREKYEKMMGVIRHNNKEKKKKDRNPRYTPRYKPEREARAYINSLSQNEKKAIKSGMINNLYHFKKNNMVSGRTPQSLEINTPDAQSDKTTQGAQSIVEGTMEEINERLMALMPDIMDEINEEIHRGPQSFSGRVDPDDIYEPIMKDEDVSEVNNPIMKNDEFSGQDTWGGQVESPSGSRTKEPYKE